MSKVFISHTTADDAFIRELNFALQNQGVSTFVDSRDMSGGDEINVQVKQEIESAKHFMVVLSPAALNSEWVLREIEMAEAAKKMKGEGYKLIPLLIKGQQNSGLLKRIFEKAPVTISLPDQPGAIEAELPRILAALGERLPNDEILAPLPPQLPLEELMLSLSDPKIERLDTGQDRVNATAILEYFPAQEGKRKVESRRFDFTAPIGLLEGEDLRWYLEDYYLWPTEIFQERARQIEANLSKWGKLLYQAIRQSESAREVMTAWDSSTGESRKRFSIRIDSEPPEGSKEAKQQAYREAASGLFSIPWELMHDNKGFLFRGTKRPVQVRRRLPNREHVPARISKTPIRILLISPRPEQEGVDYLDHRLSAKPLLAATANLGKLIEVKVLEIPTFLALKAALEQAQDSGQPYDVLHFDGHGVYDKQKGLGALCFESPKAEEQAKLAKRAMELIYADQMAELLDQNRIPLVFLESCQTAQVEADPTASVAGKLLQAGVSSVVAMTHVVLVETAQRFTGAFYSALADGKRIGEAMLAGQQQLYFDDFRGEIMGKGELRLKDWFVPVLYQEAADPPLIRKRVSQQSQNLHRQVQQKRLGALPAPPAQSFIGRSRQLLALERLLQQKPWAVIRGQGGAGKTTLAVELCRWLVESGRFGRCAFVSMEEYSDARGMVDSLGRQLIGEDYSVAKYPDLKTALQPLERALEDFPSLILLDNLESILPLDHAPNEAQQAALTEILACCQLLLAADPQTRLLFTSREFLPAPFDQEAHYQALGRLSEREAIKLVEQVLRDKNIPLPKNDLAEDNQDILALVQAANYHARALTLIAQQLGETGLAGATQRMDQIMQTLEAAHPGERENSLLASVQLSLDRLSPKLQAQAKALAVFHGGAFVWVLSQVAEIEIEAAQALNGALIQVGLATDAGRGHLRLDPALAASLAARLNPEERKSYQDRWLAAMQQLSNYLYQQRFKDAQLAADLSRLEVGNLLAMLQMMTSSAESRMNQIDTVESLLENLSLKGAMQQVISLRKALTQELKSWGHAYYLHQSKEIDRLFEQGQLNPALELTQQLLARFQIEPTYEGASYGQAMTLWRLGRIYQIGGRADLAIAPLQAAQATFESLAETGNKSAASMASACLTSLGDSYTDLGQWEAAEKAYLLTIEKAEARGAQRSVAVGKTQLASLWHRQKKYDQALTAYQEALGVFQQLKDHRTEAVAWHQIAMVHEGQKNWAGAEKAYRASLAISTREKNRAGEARTLLQLGNLYQAWQRSEEAVPCYQQAADIYVGLQSLRDEGIIRSNLADLLIKMQEYTRARSELERAIVCMESFGHVATPWNAWQILCNLEKAEGNQAAAAEAWSRARAAYLAYRRDRGQSANTAFQWSVESLQAIQTGEEKAKIDSFKESLTTVEDTAFNLFGSKLISVLQGSRDKSLADDMALYYDAAAELLWLLEQLEA
ncbi:MAG: CHAT domain-containing protein [Bacteroidota bacterium]